jgi:hypothetical protein
MTAYADEGFVLVNAYAAANSSQTPSKFAKGIDEISSSVYTSIVGLMYKFGDEVSALAGGLSIDTLFNYFFQEQNVGEPLTCFPQEVLIQIMDGSFKRFEVYYGGVIDAQKKSG